MSDTVIGKKWSTDNMAGVTVTPQELRQMQANQYILYARRGELRKVAVEKIPLPLDPLGHVQALQLFLAPDGAIYALQCTILSRSSDNGKTWEHLYHQPAEGEKFPPKNHFIGIRVLFDGTWVQTRSLQNAFEVFTSTDEGQHWTKINTIGKELAAENISPCSTDVLSNGTLIVSVTAFYNSGKQRKAFLYRSKDGGRTFSKAMFICDWGHEINIAELPSGRLLAVIRYQRPTLPSDPPNILDITGATRFKHTFPYKHVFLADSSDGGIAWSPSRQLTTVLGQCHGSAAGLKNDRVVVVHDHRYPAGFGGARAMVSDDQGQTWRDEVYYLSHGDAAGYARTVTLDGNEMLTLTGSFYGDSGDWGNLIGKSQFYVIRWRLEE